MNALAVSTVIQFTLTLENVPGTLAKVAQACFKAGVSFDGFFQDVDPSGKTGIVHFVTNDVSATRTALQAINQKFSEKKLLALQYRDKPGIVANLAQEFGNAGINLEELYVSTPGVGEKTVFYIGVADRDLEKALTILVKPALETVFI